LPSARLNGSVLVTWIDYDVDADEQGAALRAAGLRLRLEPRHHRRTAAELSGLLDDAVAAIVSTDPFTRDVLEAAPSLRVIARVGVGVDSIDLAAATDLGVAVTTTPGANDETVADHTLAVMLAAIRRVVEHDAGVRRGDWTRAGAMTPWDLHGKTVGLVGYGRIGRAVAKRLAGFGVRLLISDPAFPGDGDGDGRHVALDELLELSDVVSLHLPLTPWTANLIDADRIALLRRDAVIVNTSRGGLVDEEALADALESGRLRAAALDVFAQEPPSSDRLRRLPNVVLTPHLGGLSDGSIAVMTRRATASVLSVLRGGADEVINPEALTRAARVG
jgi:phosphoglycerate dehydrogenase-like enzyme